MNQNCDTFNTGSIVYLPKIHTCTYMYVCV